MEHDMIQELTIVQPQEWLEDTRTLPSDELLMNRVTEALKKKTWNSKEDHAHLIKMKNFFTIVIRYKKWKIEQMDRLDYNKSKPENQRKIILSDWKIGSLRNKFVLKISGGGAKKEDRNTVKERPKEP